MEINNFHLFLIYLMPGLFVIFQSLLVYLTIREDRHKNLESMSIFNPIDFTLFTFGNTLTTFIILENLSLLILVLTLIVFSTIAFFVFHAEGRIKIFPSFSILYSIIVLIEYFLVIIKFFI